MSTTEIADATSARILEVIRGHVCALLPELDPAEVRPDRSLRDLGCNSIDRTDVAAMTMDDLGVVVPVAEFAEVRDIGTLVALLRRHLP